MLSSGRARKNSCSEQCTYNDVRMYQINLCASLSLLGTLTLKARCNVTMLLVLTTLCGHLGLCSCGRVFKNPERK
eukprot:3817525-Amphidinium_carterae.1